VLLSVTDLRNGFSQQTRGRRWRATLFAFKARSPPFSAEICDPAFDEGGRAMNDAKLSADHVDEIDAVREVILD
jgi:hypothetical protein